MRAIFDPGTMETMVDGLGSRFRCMCATVWLAARNRMNHSCENPVQMTLDLPLSPQYLNKVLPGRALEAATIIRSSSYKNVRVDAQQYLYTQHKVKRSYLLIYHVQGITLTFVVRTLFWSFPTAETRNMDIKKINQTKFDSISLKEH